jgi:hypothetical protein
MIEQTLILTLSQDGRGNKKNSSASRSPKLTPELIYPKLLPSHNRNSPIGFTSP